MCCDLHPKALTNCPAPSCPMKKAGKERDTMLTSSWWTKSNQEVASYSQLIWYKNYLSLIILPCLTRYLSELARCSPTSQHAKSSHKQLFGTTSFQHLFMAKLGCFLWKNKPSSEETTRKSQADQRLGCTCRQVTTAPPASLRQSCGPSFVPGCFGLTRWCVSQHSFLESDANWIVTIFSIG